MASDKEEPGRSFEEHAAQARKIRRRTGSQDRYLKYHQAHADGLSHNRIKKPVPGQRTDDDVSTETLSEDAVTLDLSVAYYLNENCGGEDTAQIDLHADFDTGEDGEPGEDNFAVAWNDDHYRYEEGSAYTDSCDNCSVRDKEFNGVSFDWGDGAACWGSCHTEFSVGCYAELYKTDQERAVKGEYNHTWSDSEITSVGFSSSGGIVVSFSDVEKSDELALDIEEEPFEVKDFC